MSDGPPDPILHLATRVVGAPVERGGATVVPLAVVSGGSGGGSGTDKDGNLGQGAGWGGRARPVGAYVLEDGRVRYEPVVDVTRLAVLVTVVAVVKLLVIRRWLGTRR
ncbi:MAG: spore germination protein GerW family protein [Nitriliruptoraceae bacterium]